jgi:hypothetical protein
MPKRNVTNLQNVAQYIRFVSTNYHLAFHHIRVVVYGRSQSRYTLDQGVSCFSEAVACNQAVLGKLETPWARCVN